MANNKRTRSDAIAAVVAGLRSNLPYFRLLHSFNARQRRADEQRKQKGASVVKDARHLQKWKARCASAGGAKKRDPGIDALTRSSVAASADASANKIFDAVPKAGMTIKTENGRVYQIRRGYDEEGREVLISTDISDDPDEDDPEQERYFPKKTLTRKSFERYVARTKEDLKS